MGRVINPDSAGKERNRLAKEVVLAIRELMKQSQPDAHSRDLAAFISISLNQIWETIDVSVGAWEKRGYWVKAERFRIEWGWTERQGMAMRKALSQGDWGGVAATAVQTAQKLGKIKVTEHHRLGAPWVGAWETFQKMNT